MQALLLQLLLDGQPEPGTGSRKAPAHRLRAGSLPSLCLRVLSCKVGSSPFPHPGPCLKVECKSCTHGGLRAAPSPRQAPSEGDCLAPPERAPSGWRTGQSLSPHCGGPSLLATSWDSPLIRAHPWFCQGSIQHLQPTGTEVPESCMSGRPTPPTSREPIHCCETLFPSTGVCICVRELDCASLGKTCF